MQSFMNSLGGRLLFVVISLVIASLAVSNNQNGLAIGMALALVIVAIVSRSLKSSSPLVEVKERNLADRLPEKISGDLSAQCAPSKPTAQSLANRKRPSDHSTPALECIYLRDWSAEFTRSGKIESWSFELKGLSVGPDGQLKKHIRVPGILCGHCGRVAYSLVAQGFGKYKPIFIIIEGEPDPSYADEIAREKRSIDPDFPLRHLLSEFGELREYSRKRMQKNMEGGEAPPKVLAALAIK